MEQENFIMKDWQIPFMLLELSSYAQQNKAALQNEEGVGRITSLNLFFNDDVDDAAGFYII